MGTNKAASSKTSALSNRRALNVAQNREKVNMKNNEVSDFKSISFNSIIK